MEFPIAMDTYTKLCAASADTNYEKEIWEIAAEAVRDWLARNAPESFGMPKTSGYQWKSLFLPDGTVLRTIFEGKNHHCIVQGDELQFQGRNTSPSGFANGVGGKGRNAWKVLWVLLPGATTWKLAATLRTSRHRRASQ